MWYNFWLTNKKEKRDVSERDVSDRNSRTPHRSSNKRSNNKPTPPRVVSNATFPPSIVTDLLSSLPAPNATIALDASALNLNPPHCDSTTLRSMEDAHTYRDKVMPLTDWCCLPVGPFKTEDEVITAFKVWASNSDSKGGAFSVKKNVFGLQKQNARRQTITVGVSSILC